MLLTGTATEYGIDQHSIQMVQGGFNVTKEMAEAVYGKDFDADEEPEVETKQADPKPGEPVVTGSPKDGSATTAVPAETSEGVEPDEESQTVAPEHQDHDDVDYASWDYADLKAEINRRQIETEDRKAETYVAALIQSDADAADVVDEEDDDSL